MPEAVAAAVPITAQRPSQRHKFLPSDAGGILVNRSPRLSYSLLVCNLKYFSPVGSARHTKAQYHWLWVLLLRAVSGLHVTLDSASRSLSLIWLTPLFPWFEIAAYLYSP